MNEKKSQHEFSFLAFVSPPAHPTTLGNVWIGITKPSLHILVDVFGMNQDRLGIVSPSS